MFAAIGLAQRSRADDFAPWDPVTPADLAGTSSAAFPDSPAEILSWKIDVDDTNLRNERQVHEYIRYKIYDPSRAEDVTRLSRDNKSVERYKISEVTIRGRLTLPDGTTREIGQDAVHDRPILRNAREDAFAQRLFGKQGLSLDEEFVAVDGLQPGAILEFQLFTKYDLEPNFVQNLQKDGVPVRHAECVVHLYQGHDFYGSALVTNPNGLDVHRTFDQRNAVCRVTANNLPPLVDEPFSSCVNNRSVTVFDDEVFTAFTVRHQLVPLIAETSDGPWAPIALKARMLEEDATDDPSDLATSAAKKLVAGAKSETEKARRIHNFIHRLFIRYNQIPISSREMVAYAYSLPLDKVLNCEQDLKTAVTWDDFLWLALAMYRSVGLQAQMVLLPDRELMPFDARLHEAMLLPQYAARVRVEGRWEYSLPNVFYAVPFGWIPSRYESGAALVAQEGKQLFVPAPAAPAEQSTIEDHGTFVLSADGTLAGHSVRRLTGEPALLLRTQLADKAVADLNDTLSGDLKTSFPGAEVTVVSISGLDDPDAPLEFGYALTWPGYAIATRSRLIFRPSVIHGQAGSQFTAPTRKNAIEFPFHWREVDDLTLQLPSGYSLVAPSIPAPAAIGKVLSYKVTIGPTQNADEIYLHREFTSDLDGAPASAYPDLKGWYDWVAKGDAHQLVLSRGEPAAAAPRSPTP